MKLEFKPEDFENILYPGSTCEFLSRHCNRLLAHKLAEAPVVYGIYLNNPNTGYWTSSDRPTLFGNESKTHKARLVDIRSLAENGDEKLK